MRGKGSDVGGWRCVESGDCVCEAYVTTYRTPKSEKHGVGFWPGALLAAWAGAHSKPPCPSEKL